ncbi:kinase [Candidatus Syntrophocurvum alkaliphilum]|uniref:Kinase n=1 Tax=Candidatus Syntrophocurvum alkaliphilum TaxID=2293317 RepID=A0A6I6DAI1_9FIRM|nr:cofactor-independent phosphoglycerate mutase [Candidatus Syntrophocurvum alkaliphilum]QGT99818.1 kinase [Candidatus Syntrophocurvum alkaliphilum]
MKYLLIVADGMADYKIEALGNKTPLQYANTPNIDFLASSSIIGTAQTIPPGFPPGSDVANLSVIGYNPEVYYTGRSPIEAVSMGIKLDENDMALRCNLVTLSDEEDYSEKTMVDYSGGEISTEEAAQLIGAINKELGTEIINFYAGMSYRHVMVWKNNILDTLNLTPPHDLSEKKISDNLPKGEGSSLIYDLMVKSAAILKDHPVNLARMKKGLKPANSIWLWGEGSKLILPSIKELYNLNGSVVAAVDLVKGLGIASGLDIIDVEGATGAVETNFAGKGEAAINELKNGKDFVFVHIESPDEAGHQGDVDSKVWSIEQIDKEVIGRAVNDLDSFDKLRIMLLPDHYTPISEKTHTNDSVPFMIYDKDLRWVNESKTYDEELCENGMHFKKGHELISYFFLGTK